MSRIMAFEKEITEIVEFPAIICNGVIELLSPNLRKLNSGQLRDIAVAMGGTLIYRKLRATYTELERPLCDYIDCYRPAVDLYCDNHPQGASIKHIRPA